MSLVLSAAAFGLLLLSLTPRLPSRPNWLVDLPSHFTVQYSAASLLLLPLSAYFHAWIAAAVAGVIFFVNLGELAKFLPSRPEKVPEGPKLKILQANVLKSNRKPDKLRALIALTEPDIVTCCEVNPEFAAMLAGLKGDYPHQLITTGTNSYRVAVLSRLPFDKIEQAAFGGTRTQAVIFRVTLDGRPVEGVSLHPYTPIRNIRSRDGEFDAIAARFAAEKPAHLLLMGDFNATPWCPAMKRLMKALNLRNAREGRGINTTWPAFFPFLFRIPIDHVLVSANLGVANFRAGTRTGSDHLPTLTTLYIK